MAVGIRKFKFVAKYEFLFLLSSSFWILLLSVFNSDQKIIIQQSAF